MEVVPEEPEEEATEALLAFPDLLVAIILEAEEEAEAETLVLEQEALEL